MLPTILILKKSKVAANYWANVFEEAGYTVLHCTGYDDWSQLIQTHMPALLFIEATVANDQGFEMARTAQLVYPAVRCIICMPATASYYERAIQMDISGYLPDDIDDAAEVLHCIAQVRQGYRYIDST